MVVENTKCNHNSLFCHQNVIKKSKIPSRQLDSVRSCHAFCSLSFLVVEGKNGLFFTLTQVGSRCPGFSWDS